jgi:hypothetical protein
VALTLILDEPPNVKIVWGDNAELGADEGKIVNIGAGFTIPEDKVHLDNYFPWFEAPRIHAPDVPQSKGDESDNVSAHSVLAFQGIAANWRMVHRAMRFYRTNQPERMEEQLKSFWDANIGETQSLDETLYAFFLSFLGPNGERWLAPLGRIFQQAHRANESEYSRLGSHFYSLRLDRFEAYADILSEYFNGFAEFNQTLDYVLGEIEMPVDAVATSSDFDTTRMYYGNAFELLGSSLDLPASINNVLSGRKFDELKTISLSKFRTLNKANRVGAFADNGDLSRFVKEYDSTIRNASHHRWFRINEEHTKITYRSGGTGSVRTISYAEYLLRCNKITIQIALLACWELLLLSTSGVSLYGSSQVNHPGESS